jgi:hypothetical protein
MIDQLVVEGSNMDGIQEGWVEDFVSAAGELDLDALEISVLERCKTYEEQIAYLQRDMAELKAAMPLGDAALAAERQTNRTKTAQAGKMVGALRHTVERAVRLFTVTKLALDPKKGMLVAQIEDYLIDADAVLNGNRKSM